MRRTAGRTWSECGIIGVEKETRRMRNMYPDAEYFEHLDGLRRSGEWNSVLAPVSLMEAFPGLRAEEARAVCNDWRATYHE